MDCQVVAVYLVFLGHVALGMHQMAFFEIWPETDFVGYQMRYLAGTGHTHIHTRTHPFYDLLDFVITRVSRYQNQSEFY